MLTGLGIYQYIQDGIDQDYSGYLDEARANDLIRESVIRVSEKIYSNNKTQKSADELSPLTMVDVTIAVRGNRFYTNPIRISAATFISTTVTVTTELPHQLVAGDSLTIAEVDGLNINNTYTVVSAPTVDSVTFIEAAIAGLYVAETGSLTSPFMLADMQHPLAVQTTFLETLNSDQYAVSGMGTVSSPFHVNFSEKNAVRTGSVVRISDVLGVTGASGDFYVKMRTRNTFYLFLDARLTQPAVLSGTYQGGGVARLVVKEYATRLYSDRKIAPSSDASPWRPKFATTDNAINVYPTEDSCEDVKVDYIRKPPVTIDTGNDIVDLELYYNFKFLMRIKDDAVMQFMFRMRELQQAQAEAVDSNTNP